MLNYVFMWRLFAILLSGFVFSCYAVEHSFDEVKGGFRSPSNEARPRVWWHWINGNITDEGIKLDITWMHRIGVAGFTVFDVDQWTPQSVIPAPVTYMSQAWSERLRYATYLGKKYDMEEGIAGSPGFSETGGPWVSPGEAMKKYVWSETIVDGSKPFRGVLRKPPSNAGAYQTVGVRDYTIADRKITGGPDYYVDSAVIAYPLDSKEYIESKVEAKVTASAPGIEVKKLTDGDLSEAIQLPDAGPGRQSWIQFEYPTPVFITAATLVMGRQEIYDSIYGPVGDSGRTIEASDDGVHYRVLAKFSRGAFPQTVAFVPVRAKFFRVGFQSTPSLPNPFIPDIDIGWYSPEADSPSTTNEIAEIELHRTPRINCFEQKAAFDVGGDLYACPTPHVDGIEAIKQEDVVDVTSKMRSDGHLIWDPPPGKWRVIRLGYSLLGVHNESAPPEATGLEVDKLSRVAVRHYLEHYLDRIQHTINPKGTLRRRRSITFDSWESGTQNWTDGMIQEFKRRRGYDLLPWIPALTGRVVESGEATDKFLWDFRKTIADLIAENHYGQMSEILEARGFEEYTEAHEVRRAIIADGMSLKKYSAIPMGAMWVQRLGNARERFGMNADLRESASVSHIYGKQFVAAESMTAAVEPYGWSPRSLKQTADEEMLDGVNRFVIHSSVHQPLSSLQPGLSLGPYGQWFNRNETWAEDARAWIDYLSRSSYLLQQGRFVADILYFYGEDSNLTELFKDHRPSIPPGYAFDYVDSESLMREVYVTNGEIATHGGMRYKVLVLDKNSRYMSLPVLRKIRDLLLKGATIVGERPIASPSYSDDEREFRSIVELIWPSEGGEGRPVGKGYVFGAGEVKKALEFLAVSPDLQTTESDLGTQISYVHRRTSDSEIYLISNRSNHTRSGNISLRIKAKKPELWLPESGDIKDVSYQIKGTRTYIPLNLYPWETVFIAFHRPAVSDSLVVGRQLDKVISVDGNWKVELRGAHGSSISDEFPSLKSWSQADDPEVRFFSGTAVYTQNVNIPKGCITKGSQWLLDMGQVFELAHIFVNGKDLGVVWHPPYIVDVNSAIKEGDNKLVMKVTNLWVNRLIGDEQPSVSVKRSFTFGHPYKADSPLRLSGLLGPVKMERFHETRQ